MINERGSRALAVKPVVILTGTLGFIGANFIRYVVEQYPEYRWIGIDKAVYDYCLLNQFGHPNFKFYLADITNEHIIDRIFSIEKPNFVINMAAESFVCSSIENANPFIYSNVMGTQTLINASVKYNVEKFLQVSTDECYGTHISKNDIPWIETDIPKPRNPYSASKLAAENILYAANQTHKLIFNISRCCNVMGPRQPYTRNLIPKVIFNTLNNLPIPIYGDGSHMREYIYVEDKITAIMIILKLGKPNEVYNIGSGNEYSNIEIVNKISNMLDKKPIIDFTTDRKSHDYRYSVNFNKLLKLGWEPNYTFEEGLQKTIEFYIKE
jgi:dTDP-glucose 4,6-dehydratase